MSNLPIVSATDDNLMSLLASLGSSAEDLALLDAAREEFISHGFRRTSIGDIARRAAVSRPTLYRRIGDKDDIIRQVVLREVATFFVTTAAELLAADSAHDRMVEVFAAGVDELRRNPLASAVLEFDPEVLASLVRDDSTGSVALIRSVMAAGIAGSGSPTHADEQAAELILRVTVSLLVQPADLFPLQTREQAHDFASTWLAPLLDAGERSGD